MCRAKPKPYRSADFIQHVLAQFKSFDPITPQCIFGFDALFVIVVASEYTDPNPYSRHDRP